MRILADIFRLRRSSPSDWTERNAGRVIAVCVGVVGFCWLAVTSVAIPVRREPAPTIRIILETPEFPSDAPDFEDVAATSIWPSEVPNPTASIADMIRESSADGRPTLQNWQPKGQSDQALIDQILLEVANHSDRLKSRETDLKAQVQRVQIETIGREFLLNSDGGRAGIIRTLDVADFPESIVKPVFNRFGITMEYKHVNPAGSSSGRYMNAVTTRDAVYTNQAAPGYYETFVLSSKALSMMAAIETKALMDRGFEPRNSRIRKIVFGIVKDENDEFSLGVTEIEVERLR